MRYIFSKTRFPGLQSLVTVYSFSFTEIKGFQNNSSANILSLYFLHLLIVIKLLQHFIKFCPYPSISFISFYIFKIVNHRSPTYLHLKPTSPKTTWTTNDSFSWNSLYQARSQGGEGARTPPCPTKIISICPKLKSMSFLMLSSKLKTWIVLRFIIFM